MIICCKCVWHYLLAYSVIMFAGYVQLCFCNQNICFNPFKTHVYNIFFAGCVGPMIFVIAVGYLDCNHIGIVVMLIILQEVFQSATSGGHYVAIIDIAPRYSWYKPNKGPSSIRTQCPKRATCLSGWNFI